MHSYAIPLFYTSGKPDLLYYRRYSIRYSIIACPSAIRALFSSKHDHTICRNIIIYELAYLEALTLSIEVLLVIRCKYYSSNLRFW